VPRTESIEISSTTRNRAEARAITDRNDWLQTFIAIIVLSALAIGLFFATRPGTSIKVGADEDYELSKAILYVKGFHFYTEIWNDQPLLHTAIIAGILKHASPSVLGPRLVTCAFSILIVVSLFSLVRRINGLFAAMVASFLLIGSPGFIDLSSSCMVEIPGLAPAVAGLAVLQAFQRSKPKVALIVGGLLFSIAFQIKLVNLILLPVVALVIWLGRAQALGSVAEKSKTPASEKGTWSKTLASTVFDLSIFCTFLAASFLVINGFLSGGASLLQFKQMWFAHFAHTRSFEYGSPADYPFDWSILLKNWDQTILALIGVWVCLRNRRVSPWLILPVGWLFLEFIVFGVHKPWWSYYYVHNAIPTCWCAAIGGLATIDYLRQKRTAWRMVSAGVFAAAAAIWMGSRVYLEISTIRHSPQTYNSLVLTEIERFKPFCEFMFTEEGVYSFHSGIPLPPKLGILSLKRFWSGDMTNERLSAELWSVKPGFILVKNSTDERPYRNLLQSEYSMVFEDPKHQLYVRKDVVKQAKW
jgi:hypothetical protein